LARDGWFAGVSQPVVDELRRHDASLTRTLVLPNPADIDWLDANRLPRAAAREQLAIPQSVHAVGMVGRLHPEKRPSLALEAFAAARGLPDDAWLVLIGDGALRASLESSATALGIGSRVRFAGYVPDAARYLSAFDTLLFASGATEAFGMALLEAMVAGVPVVCADMPGPRSVLGPQGCYFSGDDPLPLTSALERIAQMPEAARTRLCAAQRAHAERSFSVPAVADIYRSLLSTGAPRRQDGS
jgi:glycosyltransferase involved in cell wall biosynthesis